MTLTSLMRKRNPPTKGGFETYTLEAAIWQLKASCSHHGRKMLRVCLMLLRKESQALNDIRTLDEHVRTLPGGSYWYSNDNTCGIVNNYDNARTEDEEPESWHIHGYDEDSSRRLAAERIRTLPKKPVLEDELSV